MAARPSAVATVTAPSPPNAAVTGASSSPGSTIPLFHIRLMPSGWLSASEYSGSLPSASARGVQVSSQPNSTASGSLTDVTRRPSGAHHGPVTSTASSRYPSGTPTPATACDRVRGGGAVSTPTIVAGAAPVQASASRSRSSRARRSARIASAPSRSTSTNRVRVPGADCATTSRSPDRTVATIM